MKGGKDIMEKVEREVRDRNAVRASRRLWILGEQISGYGIL